jgi:hypothetical protein
VGLAQNLSRRPGRSGEERAVEVEALEGGAQSPQASGQTIAYLAEGVGAPDVGEDESHPLVIADQVGRGIGVEAVGPEFRLAPRNLGPVVLRLASATDVWEIQRPLITC